MTAPKKLKSTPTFLPPVRKSDETWAKDNKQKSEEFEDYLDKEFSMNKAPKMLLSRIE